MFETIRVSVCKTVVAYPGESRFVLLNELETRAPIRTFATLEELVAVLRQKPLSAMKPRFIKNDVPGDIVWVPDDTLADIVYQCERLSRAEVRKMALLLKS